MTRTGSTMLLRPPAPALVMLLAGLMMAAPVARAQDHLITVGKTSYDEALAWTAVVLLVGMAGVFSGLTLGLMGLDVHGLEIVMAGSDPESARCAKRILPVRKNGNLLLCTLLFGNVAVISLTSILMSDLTSGLVGFLVSTAAIVLLGEILPQALCSRYALQTGARAVPLVKVLMALFYPVAKPVALLLDCMLGQELRTVYGKEELVKMLEIHVRQGALDEEVGRTLHGALNYKSMSVKEAMTPINQVFMLSRKEVLGYETMAKVFKAGFSRVPVYDHDHQDIVGLLLAKDLLVVDHSAGIPVDTFLRFFGRPIESLPVEMTTLGDVLALFKEGRSHMVVLTSQLSSATVAADMKTVKRGHKARGHVVGIITLMDVLQKILGMTILDEKDKEGELRRRMEARQSRRLIRSMSVGDDNSTAEEEEEDEEDEEKAEFGVGLGVRVGSQQRLAEEEEHARNRLLNTTTWLSGKMKGLKEAAKAARRSNSGGNGGGAGGLETISSPGTLGEGPVSSHLADRRPAPIQAGGTPRALAAVSLLDLFHPTPQQGKLAQQRLEAMHLAGSFNSNGGGGGGGGNGTRDLPFEYEEEYEEEEEAEEGGAGAWAAAAGGGGAGSGQGDSLNSANTNSSLTEAAIAVATGAAASAGAADAGAGAGGEGQAALQKKKKKKKKKLKHKLRKLYNYYYRGGDKVDLKNPNARGELAGALSTFVAGERARQRQQWEANQEAAAAGGGGEAGAAGARAAAGAHVAIPMEG